MSIKNDSALAYRIARYYYIDNLSQSEIAQMEQISRSTVSRMLDKARASGMVNIEIVMPVSPLIERMEGELVQKLGLKRVIVVPVSVNECNESTDETVIMDLSSIAATHLTELLGKSRTIGLGWGRTLYNTAGFLPFAERDKSRLFVPLVSNYSVNNRFLQTSTIVSRYGERFGADTYYLNISGVKRVGEPRTQSEIVNIQQLESYWDKMDAAIVSLGAPLRHGKNPYESEVEKYSKGDGDAVKERGEMISQLFFSSGESCLMGREIEVVAFPLDKLKKVKNVICIAGGVGKAEPIVYASRNGYFKTLITDHLTAGAMLEFLAKQK